MLRDFPDGALSRCAAAAWSGEVIDAARAVSAEGLLVFDPSGVTGHPDHAAATAAALLAAAGLDLPVLGWTLPAAVAEPAEPGTGHRIRRPRGRRDRHRVAGGPGRQTAACAAHVSQAIPTSVLWRRLELLGDTEHLRWLSNPPAAQELPKQKEETDDVDVCR